MLLGIHAFRLDADAPQLKATEWMALEDNACIADLNVTTVEQRYAIMTIYFGLGLDTSVSNWAAPGTHECDWDNIGCNPAKKITKIEIAKATGTLVEEFARLSSLSECECLGMPTK